MELSVLDVTKVKRVSATPASPGLHPPVRGSGRRRNRLCIAAGLAVLSLTCTTSYAKPSMEQQIAELQRQLVQQQHQVR